MPGSIPVCNGPGQSIAERAGNLVNVTDQEKHEHGLAQFVTRDWRTRFRESLVSPKRRAKLRSQLPHFSHLDSRFATQVLTSEQSATSLAARLRSKGAGDRCYLLSES